ncbi:MAG: OsmC family protein, partial [Planctomycetota bacterium]
MGGTIKMAGQEKVNGLDVEALAGCKDDLKDNPDVGKYKFRAKNEWVDGAHCRTEIKDFCAAGEEGSHDKVHVLEGDEPAGLLGEDHGPNATEALLHALGACLNASFIYHAAAQGVKVDE